MPINDGLWDRSVQQLVDLHLTGSPLSAAPCDCLSAVGSSALAGLSTHCLLLVQPYLCRSIGVEYWNLDRVGVARTIRGSFMARLPGKTLAMHFIPASLPPTQTPAMFSSCQPSRC